MQSVIVTGASRGIGAAICRSLRVQGIKVVGVARTPSSLTSLAAEKIGPGIMKTVTGNVTDPEVVEKAIRVAEEDNGELCALILNAGTLGEVGKVADSSAEQLAEAMNVNVISHVNWIKAAAPLLRKSKGRIIFTSSGVATTPYSGFSAYCATKAALNAMVGVLALEEPDIVALAVEPGIVETKMFGDFFEKGNKFMPTSQIKYLQNLEKTGGLLKPETVAQSFVKLALRAPKEKSGKSVKWNEEWINKL